MSNTLSNSDRRILSLLNIEFDLIKEELERYPIPVPPVMKREEIDGYIKQRDIILGQHNLLKRIIANTQGLIINDNGK